MSFVEPPEDACAKLLAGRPAASWFYRDIEAFPAWCFAGSIGFAYAIWTLGMSAVSGETPFWLLPAGLIGSTIDIRNTVSGYWWFVLDQWRWPLLAVVAPNFPEGANAERFDIVPVVALLGKVLHSLTGIAVNPYPWWVSACFTLNAAALAGLVRALGKRGLLAAAAAGAFGAMAPVVQARFGHLGLIAHWIPVLMLGEYFRRPEALVAWVRIIALCFLAAAVHLYLFVMTAAIGAAAFLQSVIDRRCSVRVGACGVAAVLAAGGVTLWAFGIVQEKDLGAITGDYRRYSMNLLSPFWPQTSGLFGPSGVYWLNRAMIGAVPGQYEGFCYLGFGGVLLAAVAVARHCRHSFSHARANCALVAAFSVLLAWSLSDRVYMGGSLVLSYEAPSFLATTVLSWFRSCGRFFWPLAWLLLACGIASAAAQGARRYPAALLLAALALQWLDVAPWREQLAALTGNPQVSALGSLENTRSVEALIRRMGSVAVVPAIGCSSAGWDYTSPLNAAAMEIQMIAARANARMRHPYLSRAVQSCDLTDNGSGSRVLVLLRDPGHAVPVERPRSCYVYGDAEVCIAGSP